MVNARKNSHKYEINDTNELTPKTQSTMCDWKIFNSGDLHAYNKQANTVNTTKIFVKRFIDNLIVLIKTFASVLILSNLRVRKSSPVFCRTFSGPMFL